MSSQEGKGGGGDLSSLPGTRELFLLPPKPSRRCEATYLPTPTCLHCGELCNVKKNKTLVAADGCTLRTVQYFTSALACSPSALPRTPKSLPSPACLMSPAATPWSPL